MSNLSKDEIFAYNVGLNQAQWHITKAMLELDMGLYTKGQAKQLLRFIHDEIEKEKK